MTGDMFFKIDGVAGEAKDKTHGKEIDVLAWSWGASNSGSAHIGGGAGSGKVKVHDLTVIKNVDSSSPPLLLACFSGKHFPSALLTVRKAGGPSPVEYLKIKMEGVFITSITTGSHHGEKHVTEHVSLNFSKVNLDYTPQTDKGGAGTVIPFGWDIAANSNET